MLRQPVRSSLRSATKFAGIMRDKWRERHRPRTPHPSRCQSGRGWSRRRFAGKEESLLHFSALNQKLDYGLVLSD